MVDLRPAPGPRMALQLSADDDGFLVRVVDAPHGEGTTAPVVLQRLEDVLRIAGQPTFHEDVGRGLYRSLLPDAIDELFRGLYDEAAASEQVLTLELHFDRNLARIARYPWELLHDGNRFLLKSGSANLVRYFPFPEALRPPRARSPLEVLVVSARPTDLSPLTSEYEGLERTFEGPINENKLDLAYLLPPTWDSLMDWLLAGAPSVLHFAGHGEFAHTGWLAFENERGLADKVDAPTIAGALYGTDLQLAVLSACDTLRGTAISGLGCVAPYLIMAGLPAVVAMRRRLPDDAALRFARGFYRALLAGKDVESAVMAGRKQLVRTTFWHVPTLFVRSPLIPEVQRAPLERRIDTAGPHTAPLHMPFRLGLWVRRLNEAPPSDGEVRRLLGLPAPETVGEHASGGRVQFPPALGALQPGTVEVRLIAPHCDVHAATHKRVTVFPDVDTPPIWFPVTPRRTGKLEAIFELSQHGRVVARVPHVIRVREDVDGRMAAIVRSHGEVIVPTQKPVAPPAIEAATSGLEGIDLDALTGDGAQVASGEPGSLPAWLDLGHEAKELQEEEATITPPPTARPAAAPAKAPEPIPEPEEVEVPGELSKADRQRLLRETVGEYEDWKLAVVQSEANRTVAYLVPRGEHVDLTTATSKHQVLIISIDQFGDIEVQPPRRKRFFGLF